MIKYCGTCQNNNERFCFNEEVNESKEKQCNKWIPSEDYYCHMLKDSSWYVREKFINCEISYEQFFRLVESDLMGKSIEINIYDAIEKIYGFTTVDLAEILEVPISTINYAKGNKTPSKWREKFSKTLCIPEQFFDKFTSCDLVQLEKSKNICFIKNAEL